MGATKIATCCYCGTRAALVLRGKSRHELTCANCGAPLSALKMLPKPASPRPAVVVPRHATATPRKPVRRKSFGRKVLSEVWDLVEDIFD